MVLAMRCSPKVVMSVPESEAGAGLVWGWDEGTAAADGELVMDADGAGVEFAGCLDAGEDAQPRRQKGTRMSERISSRELRLKTRAFIEVNNGGEMFLGKIEMMSL
jgi:hypothetical protein